jgi:hypothetical protein
MPEKSQVRAKAAGELACRPGSVIPGFVTCGYSPVCRLTWANSTALYGAVLSYTGRHVRQMCASYRSAT